MKFIFYKRGRTNSAVVCDLLIEFVVQEAQKVENGCSLRFSLSKHYQYKKQCVTGTSELASLNTF